MWDNKTGAPSYGVTLAQTTDGYLWVGSFRGLFRFDGVRFQEFAPDFNATLHAKAIRKLFATADNKLWISYRWALAFSRMESSQPTVLPMAFRKVPSLASPKTAWDGSGLRRRAA